MEGKGVDGKGNAITLGRCLSSLEAWGGRFLVKEGGYPETKKLLHPIHCVSAQWKSDELPVILSHCNYHYPLASNDGEIGDCGISLSAMFHYPIHAALVSLRKQIFFAFSESGHGGVFNVAFMPSEPALVK